MTKEREAKLPRWAQQELKVLRMRLDEARLVIANTVGTTPTKVELNPHRMTGDPGAMFLPNSTTVQFKSDHGTFDVGLRNGRLEISTSFWGGIAVLPRAANVVSVME